jgi:hypothetical protein
LIDFEEE